LLLCSAAHDVVSDSISWLSFLAALTAIQLALKHLNAPGGPMPGTVARIIDDRNFIDTHQYVQLSVRQTIDDVLFRTCSNGAVLLVSDFC
jgi:hypothetical protein